VLMQMKRKIIKQANQAYTLTLPIDWVRRNRIDEKSEVDVSEVEKSLIINSSNPVSGGKAKIDLNEINSKNICRIISALYAKGIDEIEIESEKDISSDILSYLNQALGYALVEQKKGIYIIKDIGGGNYKDLDEILKRVFQMLILFYESAIKDIFGESKENLESLRARDLEVNKFCLYLQRAINKSSYPDSIKGRALFTYSFELEKIGDEIHRSWRTAIKYKVNKSRQIKDLTEMSMEGLAKAFEMHYQFNSKKIEEIYSLRDKIREMADKLTKLDSPSLRFVRHIVLIVEDAADLSHLTLMMKL